MINVQHLNNYKKNNRYYNPQTVNDNRSPNVNKIMFNITI